MARPHRDRVHRRRRRARAGTQSAANLDHRTTRFDRNRYLFVTDQSRHLPVAMTLTIDQSHLGEILVAIANSRLRFQTTQVEFRRIHGAGQSNSAGPAGDRPMNMPFLPPGGMTPANGSPPGGTTPHVSGASSGGTTPHVSGASSGGTTRQGPAPRPGRDSRRRGDRRPAPSTRRPDDAGGKRRRPESGRSDHLRHRVAVRTAAREMTGARRAISPNHQAGDGARRKERIMALKDFNYKQFFFDHGERIGLGAAGVIALLLGLSLFIPGSGLFLIGSAGANADALGKSAEAVDNGIRTNQPTDADGPGDPTAKLVAFNFDLIGDARARDYEIAAIGETGGGGHTGRGKPDIYLPRESHIALVRFQLPTLVFDSKLDYVQTLKNFVNPAGPMGGMPFMPNMGAMANMFKGAQQPGYDPRQALNTASGKKAARRSPRTEARPRKRRTRISTRNGLPLPSSTRTAARNWPSRPTRCASRNWWPRSPTSNRCRNSATSCGCPLTRTWCRNRPWRRPRTARR